MDINKNIMVSIICITYEQVNYIRDAIESFLNQKTNFAYEILIYDDASTDGTAEVVKEYAKRYPEKIVPILQTENQYSKGIKITKTFVFPMVRGKYVAFCEGDDFWTDENKLQKQFDYMEKNPNCQICLHHGYSISADKKISYRFEPLSEMPCVFGMKEAIQGLGIKTLTNSFFYRAEMTKKPYPPFMEIAPTGDYGTVIQAVMEGGYIYYMPEKMSAHRCCAKNSLTERWAKNPKFWERYIQKQMVMLDQLDQDTGYRYSDIIKEEKIKQTFDNNYILRDKMSMKVEPYKTMFRKLSLRKKLQFYCPSIYKFLQKFYHIFRRESKYQG